MIPIFLFFLLCLKITNLFLKKVRITELSEIIHELITVFCRTGLGEIISSIDIDPLTEKMKDWSEKYGDGNGSFKDF